MEIAHDVLLNYLKGDRQDPAWIERIGYLLVPEPDQERRRPLIQQWVMDLPTHEVVEKIGASLTRLTKESGGDLTSLRWWNVIVDKKHHLFAVVHRSDGTLVKVHFQWKEALHLSPDEVQTMRLPVSFGWAKHHNAPSGYCFEIESPAWETLKATFHAWLYKPLDPPPPSNAGSPPRTANLAV